MAAVLLLGLRAGPWVAAQTGEDWAAPVNLSHSGAASLPALVAGQDGALRAFWWDRFDGITVSEGRASATGEGDWSESARVPILIAETVRDETVYQPIAAMPAIVGDRSGGAHALWLGDPDDETGERALLHSRLPADQSSWSGPAVAAGSASVFALADGGTGVLHLAYVRPTEVDGAPAGVYCRRSTDGGATWSRAYALDTSLYYRLVGHGGDELDIDLRLAAGADEVAVTWDDPRQQGAVVSLSRDGGETWRDPHVLEMARHARPFIAPDGEAWVLWQDARTEGVCVLRQAPARDLVVAGDAAAVYPAGEWTTCPQGERFWPVDGSWALASSGNGGEALTFAHWACTADMPWSVGDETRFRFSDAAKRRTVELSDLQSALVGAPQGPVVAVAGTGDDGEVWLTSRLAGALRAGIGSGDPRAATLPADAGDGPVPLASNLSHSAAASSPVLVTGPDGMLRALWWDRFDGLVLAEGIVDASTVLSGTEEVEVLRQAWGAPQIAPAPFGSMPHIVSDGRGYAHATWYGDARQGGRTLLYARLAPGTRTWSAPVALAESAVEHNVYVDGDGTLHLAYVRSAHTDELPAGVYYRRSEGGGAVWSQAAHIYGSLYYRLLEPGAEASDPALAAHVRTTADEAGRVAVTWDDPQLGRAMVAQSEDGTSWSAAQSVGGADTEPRRGHVFSVPGGETWLLWEDVRYGGPCALYQASLSALVSDPGAASERVLTELGLCPEAISFRPLGEGQVLMVGGEGTGMLSLALWDGRWSVPRQVGYRFADPEGRHVYLGELRASWLEGNEALVSIGVDQAGEVWATRGETLDVVFAPPSPWSGPVLAAEGGLDAGQPALAVDEAGNVHALWAEAGEALYYARADALPDGTWRWSRPAAVLRSPEGGVSDPALVSVGDRLHAAWSGGPGGEVLYSQSFARDAHAANGWSPPRSPASSPVGGAPDLVASGDGALHLVYAVPLNEGRGVCYARSEDGGQSWLPEVTVYDAEAGGWERVGSPRTAVGGDGTIHVVWSRESLPGQDGTLGIYAAESIDGGLSWSAPVEVAAGAHAWPQVLAGLESAHLLWGEAGGRSWWHQWSDGTTWSRPERVRGLQGVPGPTGASLAVLSADSEVLHLVGLGADRAGESALIHVAWQDGAWGEAETLRLPPGSVAGAGASAALQPVLGRLHAVYRGSAPGDDGTVQAGLWHTDRAVTAVDPAALPQPTPRPTPTPLPPPTRAPTPTPRPTVNVLAPPAPPPSGLGPIDLPLPLIGSGVVAVVLVGAVLVTRSRRR